MILCYTTHFVLVSYRFTELKKLENNWVFVIETYLFLYNTKVKITNNKNPDNSSLLVQYITQFYAKKNDVFVRELITKSI